jgi:UDP-glucose 4-epimerase
MWTALLDKRIIGTLAFERSRSGSREERMTPGDFGRTVVTGGAGFIGSHLVNRLVGSGAKVIVVDMQAPASEIAGVDYVRADLRDSREARDAIGRANLVFHLAGTLDAIGSFQQPDVDFESNVITTLNVLRAARSAGVRRFVFMSSALVYGLPSTCPVREDAPLQPVFPYAMSKHTSEGLIAAFCAAHHISYVIGRTFVTYGSNDSPTARAEVPQYLRALRAGAGIEILGNPDAKTRDFVHVFDVVEALLLLASRTVTGVFNVGSGEETSLRELVSILARALGQPVPELSWVPSPEDECRLVADISRLSALGFRPSIGIEAGIDALVASALPAGRPDGAMAGAVRG